MLESATRDFQRYAVLGWPIRHSVSPAMQNAAFRAAGIPAAYERIAVPPEEFGARIAELKAAGYAGWNVTVPHKARMLELVDEAEEEARLARSVNTVVCRGGRLFGASTDGYGLAAAVRENFGLELAGRRVVLLGAGGAARAVAVYMIRRGAAALCIANRTPSRAEALAELLEGIGTDCELRALPLSDPIALPAAIRNSDLVVQATSAGLRPGEPPPIPVAWLAPHTAVFEMIYRPTPFLAGARARGCRAADGRGMLLHQGAQSFRIWTGRPAPLEVMRRALNQALGS